MQKTAIALFPDAESEQIEFLDSLLSPTPKGNAVIWTSGERTDELKLQPREGLPSWLPGEIDLLEPEEKAGKSRAYRDGLLYSLDYSSVLTASALLALSDQIDSSSTVLDACAAPGGKSILCSTLLKPGLLLSNEVEGKRLGMLRHNLTRCRIPNAYTQRMPVHELAEQTRHAFDLCLVDAPCSGQSLLAKGQDVQGCFHPSIVKGNARRQRKILSACSETVRPGGFLFYSTCTFSQRENEGAIEKFLTDHPDFAPLEVPHLAEYRSTLSEFPSYRIYPHRSNGAGGFVCLLQRSSRESEIGSIPDALLAYPVAPPSSIDSPE